MNERVIETAIPHGTYGAYTYHGCGCGECRAANTEYHQKLKDMLATRTPPRHGRSGYVNYGCRCDVCRAANSAAGLQTYERLQRGSEKHATRTRLRWSPADDATVLRTDLTVSQIARLLGRTYGAVSARRMRLHRWQRQA